MADAGERSPGTEESLPPQTYEIVWRIALGAARRLERWGHGNAATLAPDLSQAILLHIWCIRAEWAPTAPWDHFVAKVAARKAVDLIRKHIRGRVPVSLDDPDRPVLRELSRRAEDPVMRLTVEECIAGLPKAHRVAVRMVLLTGMTAQECEARHGWKAGTVRQWVLRARNRLKRCLSGASVGRATGDAR